MVTDNHPEPKKVKWWKLAVRPKADSYTNAGLVLVYAVMAATGAAGWRYYSLSWRIAAVVACCVAAAFAIRRGFRHPPDPPIEIVG